MIHNEEFECIPTSHDTHSRLRYGNISYLLCRRVEKYFYFLYVILLYILTFIPCRIELFHSLSLSIYLERERVIYSIIHPRNDKQKMAAVSRLFRQKRPGDPMRARCHVAVRYSTQHYIFFYLYISFVTAVVFVTKIIIPTWIYVLGTIIII